MELLGSGAYAFVFKVQDDYNGNWYALRVIPERKMSDNLARFVQSEYDVIRKLHESEPENPVLNSIPQYYKKFRASNSTIFTKKVHLQMFLDRYSIDKIESDDMSTCILMEFIPGISLGSIYKRQKALDSPYGNKTLSNLIGQFLQALSYMHKLNLVHRDIKLDNMMYDKSMKRLVIIDYGFSCTTVKNMSYTCVANVGSPLFKAPELLKEATKIEKLTSSDSLSTLKAADIWAGGITFYELATLEPAYDSKDREDLYKKIRSGETPWIQDDDRVSHIINDMLVYDYKKRPSAQKLLDKYYTSK